MEENTRIILYRTVWCSGTWFARRLLDEHQISYQWVDIDQDPRAAAYVEEINRGYRSVPTIIFSDGSILVEPSQSQLERKLGALLFPYDAGIDSGVSYTSPQSAGRGS
ncbi:MAG: glutaredoxin domain-containing protein [Chloroflexota bacterium]